MRDEMDRERLNETLLEIAGRKKQVRFKEIKSLLDNHIGPLYPNYNHHGNPHHAFTVGDQTFNIAEPKGTPFVKQAYVIRFLNAMETLGLFTEAD